MVHGDVLTIDVNDSVQDGAGKLKRSDMFLLPVESQGRLVGTLSQGDVDLFRLRQECNETLAKVKEVMDFEFITCAEESFGLNVATLVARTNIQRVIVMNGQRKAVGFLSL